MAIETLFIDLLKNSSLISENKIAQWDKELRSEVLQNVVEGAVNTGENEYAIPDLTME